MENKTNTYEVLFAVSMKNGEETAAATAEKIKTLIADNGEIVAIDVWGKRRLAYPINFENEGYYVLIYFKSAPTFVSELTRVLGITEDALRYIVLAVDEKKQTINVRHEAPVEETADEAEAVEPVAAEPVAEAAEAVVETVEAEEPAAEAHEESVEA